MGHIVLHREAATPGVLRHNYFQAAKEELVHTSDQDYKAEAEAGALVLDTEHIQAEAVDMN